MAIDVIEVVVEIPRGSRNKYELDKSRGVFILDRVLYSSVHYPTDYGFVPDTLAEDGDPLDVLVIVDEPTFPGCHIEVRPLGVFWMQEGHTLSASQCVTQDWAGLSVGTGEGGGSFRFTDLDPAPFAAAIAKARDALKQP